MSEYVTDRTRADVRIRMSDPQYRGEITPQVLVNLLHERDVLIEECLRRIRALEAQPKRWWRR